VRSLHQSTDLARDRRALSPPWRRSRNAPARYNICPTDTIDVVIERGGKRDLVPMPWGLIPNWWKKSTKEIPAIFNARAETVATKPIFRDAFKRSRCLIPASGYYEWLPTPTGKQPYYYTAGDGSPLTFAGLWDALKSCTMIVTNANALAAKVHDRMPVLLQPQDFDDWLKRTTGTEFLKPAPDDYLQAWSVSRRVNSSKTAGDDPTLIDQAAACKCDICFRGNADMAISGCGGYAWRSVITGHPFDTCR
jgi:putative SOS response-associated peptidase YedK